MIQNVCICGGGTMGSGIAQVLAQHGYEIIVFDVMEMALQTSAQHIQTNFNHLVSTGKLSESVAHQAFARIRFTDRINECAADLIIEAIAENLASKKELFQQLAGLNSPETIFTTNTSSIRVSEIAEQMPHRERVAGLHFFNPAPVMKLVEVAATPYTSAGVIDKLVDLVQKLGKQAVVCQDVPGFIVNRVARPYYLEALRLAEENAATLNEIDDLTESAGFRMGPFRLMDLIGNDVNLAVSQSLYEALGEPERLRPSTFQQQKVDTGELGKKSGKGYYNYRQGG